jgi:hypothetical protein
MILSLVRNPPFLSHQNCCKTIYPPCNTLCVWAPDYPRTSSTIKSFVLFFQAIRPKLSLLLLPSSISCCEIPSSRSLIFSTSSASNAWIYKVFAGLLVPRSTSASFAPAAAAPFVSSLLPSFLYITQLEIFIIPRSSSSHTKTLHFLVFVVAGSRTQITRLRTQTILAHTRSGNLMRRHGKKKEANKKHNRSKKISTKHHNGCCIHCVSEHRSTETARAFLLQSWERRESLTRQKWVRERERERERVAHS